MITTLLRIIKYGGQSFFRNGWLSTATIVIMVTALLVVGNLIVFNIGMKNAISSVRSKIDVSVYFKDGVSEKAILSIQKELETLPEVASIEYVSKEKALELFRENNKNYPTINQALEEFDENPLAASLNIKAKDPKEFSKIVDYINGMAAWRADIDKISYTETQIIIDRLTQIFDSVQVVGWTVTIFLMLTAILVTFSTISLAIYSNREEIGIMRLVGASNYFIRGPYIVTGIIYGLIASVTSFLIIWMYVWFNSATSNFYTLSQLFIELGIPKYFHANFFGILGYQLLFGVVLGIASSVIAIGRYLKV